MDIRKVANIDNVFKKTPQYRKLKIIIRIRVSITMLPSSVEIKINRKLIKVLTLAVTEKRSNVWIHVKKGPHSNFISEFLKGIICYLERTPQFMEISRI